MKFQDIALKIFKKHLSFVAKACKELKRENQLLKKENAEIKTYITIIQEELEMKYSDYKGSSICKDYGHSLIAACLCITILYLCLPIIFYIIMKIFLNVKLFVSSAFIILSESELIFCNDVVSACVCVCVCTEVNQ